MRLASPFAMSTDSAHILRSPAGQRSRRLFQRLRLISSITVVGLLSVGQTGCRQSAPEATKPAAATPSAPATAAPPTAQSSSEGADTPRAAVDQLPSDGAIAKMLEPSKGDLDSMIERRYIR